jgi:uncharacterized RmlC-like cupin family protein
MTYTADQGAVSAVFHVDDTVERLQIGTTVADLVAPGTRTEGRFGLYRWHLNANSPGAPSAHFHRTFSESFYILDGTVHLYDGATWNAARPGDFLYVPEGGVHGFRNISDAAASMLIMFAPGAPREDYFRALADVITNGKTLSDDEWTELYARHDQYMVDVST